MITNETLLEFELPLKDLIREHYKKDFSFEANTFGDIVLQAARVTLFMTDSPDDDITGIFKEDYKRREFFKLVKKEIREPGSELKFMTSLDKVISKEEYLVSLLGEEISLKRIFRPDLVLVHKGRVICNTSELLGDDIRNLVAKVRGKEHAEDLSLELTKMISILEKGYGTKYWSINSIYQKNLETIYEKIRKGKISCWKKLNRNHIPFFDWDVNLRSVIRYATENYILPYYKCGLEDLPLQGGLEKELIKNKISLQKRFNSIRDCFILAYPEMKNRSHWHPARWIRRGEPSKEKKEYWEFRRKYLFEHKLKCETKEDVINSLNNDKRLKQVMKAEKIYSKIYANTIKRGVVTQIHPYKLIEDLDGDIYNINEWELEVELPRNTFKNQDGSVNREKVGKYLLWVDEKYGLPLDIVRSSEATVHIPHYQTVRQNLSASEIRDIYREVKQNIR